MTLGHICIHIYVYVYMSVYIYIYVFRHGIGLGTAKNKTKQKLLEYCMQFLLPCYKLKVEQTKITTLAGDRRVSFMRED